MKLALNLLAASLTAVVLIGCASTRSFATNEADAPQAEGCEQRTPEVFALTGKIDPRLADCVRRNFAETTRELVLDSEGGSVEAALDIAEMIEGRRLVMRVEGKCNSSCANYFLPLAGRIVVEAKGMVLLHGGIDPWTIDRWQARKAEFIMEALRNGVTVAEAETAFAKFLANAEVLVARQADFAERNRVSPGWLLHRTPGSDDVHGLAHHPTRGFAVLVEERMMRSCLSNVQIEPYQHALERHWIRSPRRVGLIWARTRPSGQAICVS